MSLGTCIGCMKEKEVKQYVGVIGWAGAVPLCSECKPKSLATLTPQVQSKKKEGK